MDVDGSKCGVYNTTHIDQSSIRNFLSGADGFSSYIFTEHYYLCFFVVFSWQEMWWERGSDNWGDKKTGGFDGKSDHLQPEQVWWSSPECFLTESWNVTGAQSQCCDEMNRKFNQTLKNRLFCKPLLPTAPSTLHVSCFSETWSNEDSPCPPGRLPPLPYTHVFMYWLFHNVDKYLTAVQPVSVGCCSIVLNNSAVQRQHETAGSADVFVRDVGGQDGAEETTTASN